MNKNNVSVKTKAKISWYNSIKKVGEAQGEKGQKITITEKSFSNENLEFLKKDTEIECSIFNLRENGLVAYSASIIK